MKRAERVAATAKVIAGATDAELERSLAGYERLRVAQPANAAAGEVCAMLRAELVGRAR